LNRYVDLVQRYGFNWRAARKHFYKYGWKEKRNYRVEDTKSQKNIAGGPKFVSNQYKKFRCNGDMHYARLSLSPSSTIGKKKNNRPPADSFLKVADYQFRTRRANPRRKYYCHGSTFGKDPAPYFWKQCFCEVKPRKEPRVCAKEGQKCRSCRGVVFYGVRKVKGFSKVATLEQMMSKNYRWKETRGTVRCTNSVFGDPNRGHAKQCYCDDVKYIDIAKVKADEAYNKQREELKRQKRRRKMLAAQRRRRIQQEQERARKSEIERIAIQTRRT